MSSTPPNFDPASATPMPHDVVAESPRALDDDIALGWECANPSLQIDLWGAEGQAQPFSAAY